MTNVLTNVLILITITRPQFIFTKFIETTETSQDVSDGFDNNIIDFEEDISLKVNKKYGILAWNDYNYNKDNLRYTIVSESEIKNDDKVATNDNNLGKTVENLNETKTRMNINEKDSSIISNSTNKFNISDIKYDIKKVTEETTTQDYSVIPLELISTTQNILISIIESTTEPDLTVIPLSTTVKVPKIVISETVTLPTSTQNSDLSTIESETVTKSNIFETTEINQNKTQNEENFTTITNISEETTESYIENTNVTTIGTTEKFEVETTTIDDPIFKEVLKSQNIAVRDVITTETDVETSTELKDRYKNATFENDEDTDIPLYTELDAVEEIEVPEDYYDAKDVVPTTAPKTDALSVIFGLAGTVVESVVESVAERVVPKGIFDLFKRMQRQSEAIEAEKLRSREENGGIGQFGRGILKSLSSGISRPLSQLMAGVRDIGSLDSDRGFVSSLASGVTSVANVANSVVDAFKDRVQAIYPGTVWCGDGRSATARSSDLGLFFFTDTCCRQHDACKIFIRAGETKYGLTNTGLFTRSHCSCDAKFRECLRRTNSLVSAQIGLTYFNVLGPQCFRRAHPIVKCIRRTRITGQKCEEYELDYSKPRMWQWFDNETF